MAEQGFAISRKFATELRKMIRYEMGRPKGRPLPSQGTEPNGKRLLFVKLTQDLNSGGKATADIYNAPTDAASGGVGTVSTNTIKSVTVYDPSIIASGKKIASGKYCWVTNARGRWELLQASDCPA